MGLAFGLLPLIVLFFVIVVITAAASSAVRRSAGKYSGAPRDHSSDQGIGFGAGGYVHGAFGADPSAAHTPGVDAMSAAHHTSHQPMDTGSVAGSTFDSSPAMDAASAAVGGIAGGFDAGGAGGGFDGGGFSGGVDTGSTGS